VERVPADDRRGVPEGSLPRDEGAGAPRAGWGGEGRREDVVLNEEMHMPDKREHERERHEGTEPDEAVREAATPDQEGVGEAVADAIRPPDFRTKTSSPSTSERRLRKDELPEGEGSQG